MYGLDLARAVLMLVGVIYHGALLFKTGGGWRIESESTHQIFNVLADGIHLFRMHAFYILAGFFVAMVTQKSGNRTAAWSRIGRLAIPMLFVGFTANTLMNQFSAAWEFDSNIATYIMKGQWLGPLWFIGNLIAYYALSPIVLGVIEKIPQLDRAKLWMLTPVLFVTALAMVVAVSISGKYLPEMFLMLHFKNLLLYFPVFVLGLLLHRTLDVFTKALSLRGTLLILGAAAGMRVLASVLHFYDIHYVLGETMQQYFALAVALAVMAMFNKLAKPSPVLQYFVDASYTLYLIHMPVIVVLHTLLASLHLHWSVEYPLIITVTSGLCLLFHHQIVARIPLAGLLLNGTKLARKSGGSNQMTTAPVTS
jgi:peptidoglycan/LPS O-acetylase OafA/YrhL